MIERIGPYRIQRKLGEGGMGVVYAAVDERLDRPVALKWMREALPDSHAHERFLREARAAARVSHPNICPIYALDEYDGRPCIAMELLGGETLAERVLDGPIAAAEARRLFAGVLDALAALHSRGLVHRDIKPTNVMLTPRGPVLLDFGLARDLDAGEGAPLTRPGVVIGTPAYMAPEQAQGRTADARTDVFAAGLLLYEMLAGRPAFRGDTVFAILYDVINADPPPLPEPLAGAFGGVLARALAKDPGRRYADAAAMATALDEVALVSSGSASGSVPAARAVTRLLALPLRAVRSDPETDYLAYSLPDAAAASLGNLESLVVRSTATGARFAQQPSLDLDAIAREAGVDVVLSGTLMRAGERVRVHVQLIEVPSGTLVTSQVCEAPLADLFQLEDELGRKVVEALRLPLTAREHRLLGRDVPADPKAYIAYLRANRLMAEPRTWAAARDLYLEAVTADPLYAPAWARLGRAQRVLGKFGEEASGERLYSEAAQSFRRALELNPELPAAHHLVTHLEVETGRVCESIGRLLERLHARRHDPELYAGLVTACRFGGMLDESMRAHDQAVRLDPLVPTSVGYTLLARGEFEAAIATDRDSSRFVAALSLAALGRTEESLALFAAMYEASDHAAMRAAIAVYAECVRREPVRAEQALIERRMAAFHDPEGLFLAARGLAYAGVPGHAFEILERSIAEGFTSPATLRRDPWFESLRGQARFDRVLEAADAGSARARAAFDAGDGARMLGTAATR